MRVATGLLLALWLLFMGFKFWTTQPMDYDGEIMRMLSGILLFIQLIAWVFIFTMPLTTFVILFIAEVIAIVLAFGLDLSYILFAVINLIFMFMSFAGHRELVKRKAAAKKKSAKTT
ncbi:hypothetical protein SAMN04487895_12434 [Paenibacillus sophorae]|uniref:Uncharacterized protein n=1 Tax=Paenibacillus sophorae TaxID=1333845 RepID=A0A1H8VHE8_9BACL|nr:hypothetical protein [Paenibacillus sophorae]QWU15428.1 hypothetical protein KP014_26740 [Paenibacillus sophorae]SEP14809.1 hypothetical protein SAMN04487895_12434 [Paenibacillus sophorae]